MTQANSALYDDIPKLPIDPVEETELHEILANEDGIASSEMFAMIKELPDD